MTDKPSIADLNRNWDAVLTAEWLADAENMKAIFRAVGDEDGVAAIEEFQRKYGDAKKQAAE